MRRPTGAGARWVLLALLLLPAGPLHASTVIRLDAEPPPADCPDVAALEADVIRQLGRDPFSASAARVFTVRWSRDDTHRVAELAVVEGGVVRGRRRLVSRADECAALHRAVGLLLAIALDPLRLGEPLPAGVTEAVAAPEPAPEPEPAPAPVSEPEPAPPPAPEPPASEVEPDGQVVRGYSAGMYGAWGFTPTLAVGAAVGVRWRLGALGFGGGLTGAMGLGDPVGAGTVSAALLGAHAAGGLHAGSLALEAVAVGGWLPAWGSGFDQNARSDAPFAGVGARVGYALSLADGWALRPAVEVLRPLVGARLLVDGRAAWQTPAVVVSAGADLLF